MRLAFKGDRQRRPVCGETVIELQTFAGATAAAAEHATYRKLQGFPALPVLRCH